MIFLKHDVIRLSHSGILWHKIHWIRSWNSRLVSIGSFVQWPAEGTCPRICHRHGGSCKPVAESATLCNRVAKRKKEKRGFKSYFLVKICTFYFTGRVYGTVTYPPRFNFNQRSLKASSFIVRIGLQWVSTLFRDDRDYVCAHEWMKLLLDSFDFATVT